MRKAHFIFKQTPECKVASCSLGDANCKAKPEVSTAARTISPGWDTEDGSWVGSSGLKSVWARNLSGPDDLRGVRQRERARTADSEQLPAISGRLRKLEHRICTPLKSVWASKLGPMREKPTTDFGLDQVAISAQRGRGVCKTGNVDLHGWGTPYIQYRASTIKYLVSYVFACNEYIITCKTYIYIYIHIYTYVYI